MLHQKDVTYQCTCKKIYDPVNDIQRYCEDCRKWYDIECCKSIAEAFPRPLDIKEKIYRMPIMRGALGSVNDEWRVSGSDGMRRGAFRTIGKTSLATIS